MPLTEGGKLRSGGEIFSLTEGEKLCVCVGNIPQIEQGQNSLGGGGGIFFLTEGGRTACVGNIPSMRRGENSVRGENSP